MDKLSIMERVAIDTCLRNNQKKNAVLNRIEELEANGVLKIVVSQRFVDECRDSAKAEIIANDRTNISEPLTIGHSKIGYAYIASNKPVSFNQIAAIMFPDKNPESMTKNDINDVMHIMSCIHANVKYFVTYNKWDFIGTKKNNQNRNDNSRLNNKRVALEKFGINILTPEELLIKFEPENNLL